MASLNLRIYKSCVCIQMVLKRFTNCSSRTSLVPTPQHCAPIYVRLVCSRKEQLDKSHSKEKPTSHGYKCHQAARSTAANKAFGAASNKHLSLHQPAHCLQERRTC